MASQSCPGLLSCLVILVTMGIMMSRAGAQVTHKLKWTVPSLFGNDTLSGSVPPLQVGDSLAFEFTAGAHNVMWVNKADYEVCNSLNPIATWTAAPTIITFLYSGTFRFICGVPMHCALGQALTVNVLPSLAPITLPFASPSLISAVAGAD